MKSKSIIIIFMAIIIMLSVLLAAGPVYAADYVTKPGYIAALTKELLDKALGIYHSGDRAALNRLMENNEFVFVMKGGVRVYVEDWTWGGYVKIRPSGHTISIWTLKEAIK